MRELQWVVSNLGIAGGYYVLALALSRLLQQFMTVGRLMKAGAAIFFATCAFTHIEHAYHVLEYPDVPTKTVLLSNHSIIIHDVQVLGVWMFIFGTLGALRHQRSLDVQTAQTIRKHTDEK